MYKAVEKLTADNAAVVESATVIPTYYDALALAVQFVIAMNPTSIRISLSFQKGGFVIVHSGFVNPAIHALEESIQNHLRPLEKISKLTIANRIGSSERTHIRCVSFGKIIRSSYGSKEALSTLTVQDLFHNIPVRCKMIENALAQKSKMLFEVKLGIQKYALIHPTIRWTLTEESEGSILISLVSARNGNLLNSFQNVFGFVQQTPKLVLSKDSRVAIESLFWSWTDPCDVRIQQFFVDGVPVDIPPLAKLLQDCVLLTRTELQSQNCKPAPFVIVIKSSLPTSFKTPVPHSRLAMLWDDHIPPDVDSCFRRLLSAAFLSLYPNCTMPLRIRKLTGLNDYLNPKQDNFVATPNSNQTYSDSAYDVNLFAQSAPKKDNFACSTGSNPFNKRFCRRQSISESSNLHISSKNYFTTSMKFDQSMIKRAEVINQVDKKFIIAKIPYEDRNLIVAIDQHAADERIQLEMFRSQVRLALSQNRIDCVIQSPVRVLYWSDEDMSLLETNRDLVKQWGFHIQKLKDGNFGLRNCPRFFDETLDADDLLNFVRQLEPKSVRKYVEPPKVTAVLSSKACRSAIMFGDELDKEQCKKLLTKLSSCQFPFQCAHGRPSIIPLGLVGIGITLEKPRL